MIQRMMARTALALAVALLLVTVSAAAKINAAASASTATAQKATTATITVHDTGQSPGLDSGTVPPAGDNGGRHRHWIVLVMLIALGGVMLLVCVYAVRHYWFTLNRLFGRQRHPYLDIDTAVWPEVTVLIPAHNEEAVIAGLLDALLVVDYPRAHLRIMPIDDRSTDRTGAIVDDYARRYPGQITPVHRRDGMAGKAAALKEATALVQTGIVLVFDADYVPGKGLIKQLVAPFFDPEVGAMMGRVVPRNVGRNLLTRLLDLERSGGYQVDQQARMNMHLIPQYGGTVGGVRLSALKAVGGWDDSALAEDTEITYRLLLGGWKTVYQNRSECYEEVPENWDARLHQVLRWARGHNQTAGRYCLSLLRSRRVSRFEKIDGLLLLGVYVMSPVLLLGWILAISLFYLGEQMMHGAIAVLAITSYGALGNFAAFFEIGSAARLDRRRQAVTLLPMNLWNFLVGLLVISRASLGQLFFRSNPDRLEWHKTERYRSKQR
jgi:cellulose synthase/poly-beta-1,6-N-acetylglucosamine synthase-like glycosyltransferase